MVNFRFHLVSLTAVFLALAAGITIGAGVVDRATVDQIERQLRDVDSRREATNTENDRLRTELGRWTSFGEQLGTRPIDGRLAGATVFLVGTSGVDRSIVEELERAIAAAGATIDGTLWFTGKWAIESEDDASELAGLLDALPTADASDLRASALSGVAAAWATGDSSPLVTALADAGFFEFEPGDDAAVPLGQLPRQPALFVVVSGDDADVPVADLAHPLVARLAGSDLRVLAAQPARPPSPAPGPGDEERPPEFVLGLRADSAVATRISTVDNGDDYRGRVAAVLALRELQNGETGHYGFGPETRRVPEPSP